MTWYVVSEDSAAMNGGGGLTYTVSRCKSPGWDTDNGYGDYGVDLETAKYIARVLNKHESGEDEMPEVYCYDISLGAAHRVGV